MEAEYARRNELSVGANAHDREVLFAALTAVWYSQGDRAVRRSGVDDRPYQALRHTLPRTKVRRNFHKRL